MYRCYITGAGENYGLDFTRDETDYVIAADGGYRYLKEVGIEPDLVVGDFDSLDSVPEHENITRLPREKDVTDTWEAVSLGRKLGFKEFHLYACMGGRTDHTIANIQLLKNMAEEGLKAYLYDKDTVLMAVKDSGIGFDARMSGTISVFSLSDKSSGVDIEGLKYPLRDQTLSSSFPLGISNEFIGKPSMVSVKEGTLLIIFPGKRGQDDGQ